MPLRRRQFLGAAGSLAAASLGGRDVVAEPAEGQRPRNEPVPRIA